MLTVSQEKTHAHLLLYLKKIVVIYSVVEVLRIINAMI